MVDLGAGAVSLLLVAEAPYHLKPPMLHSATHMLTIFYVQPSRRSDDQRNAVFDIEYSLTIMRSFFLLSCLPAWEPSYASCIHGIKRTTRVGCTSYIAVFTRLSVDNELRENMGGASSRRFSS